MELMLCNKALERFEGGHPSNIKELNVDAYGGPIWMFPTNGGTPKWMVYNGKPY